MARAFPVNSSEDAVTVPGVEDYDLNRVPTEFFTEGVVRGFGVTQRGAGANMSVDIAAGLAVIEITNTNVAHGKTYKTWFEETITTNKPITTADATNPRKDRVVLRIDVSTDPNVSASNIAIIEVIAGTPAGSPSAPAEPSNAITLAIVDVPASDTSITTGQITDSRTFLTLNTAVLLDVIRAVNLASTANGKGASQVGVEDSADNFTGDTVEEVLAELQDNVDAVSGSVPLKYANTSDSNDITTGGSYTLVDFNTAYTIAAGSLSAGMVYEMIAEGIVSTSSDLGIKFGVKVGSTVITFNNSPSSLPSAGGTHTWRIVFRFICRTTGATGTIECSAYFTCRKADHSEWKTELIVPDSTSTVDTTGTLVLCPQAGWQTDTYTRHAKVKNMTVNRLV